MARLGRQRVLSVIYPGAQGDHHSRPASPAEFSELVAEGVDAE